MKKIVKSLFPIIYLMFLMISLPTTISGSTANSSNIIIDKYFDECDLHLSTQLDSTETEHNGTNSARLIINSGVEADYFKLSFSCNDIVKVNNNIEQLLDASNYHNETILSYNAKKDGYGEIVISVEAIKDGNVIAKAGNKVIYVFATETGDFHSNRGFYELEIAAIDKEKRTKDLNEKEYKDKLHELSRKRQIHKTTLKSQKSNLSYGVINNILASASEYQFFQFPQNQMILSALIGNQVEVNGTVKWTDQNGIEHPAQNVKVEIHDQSDSLFDLDNVLCTTYTDNTGYYSAIINNDNNDPDGGYDIRVDVFAEGENCRVVIPGIFLNIHKYSSPVTYNIQNLDIVTEDVTFTNADDLGRAFQVHQAAMMAAKFVEAINGSLLPMITVDYPDNDGPYYSGNVISLLNGYHSEWDVIQHEYGHYVQDKLNLDNSPGGSHSSQSNLTDYFNVDLNRYYTKDEAIRLSWGEGWATYFAISLQKENGSVSLGIPNVGDSYFQDTYQSINQLVMI